jgi:glutamate racemase
MNIPLKTYRELTRLRNLLQQITQISFTYNATNKRYPFEHLDEDQAGELIQVYNDLLQEVNNLKSEINGRMDKTT